MIVLLQQFAKDPQAKLAVLAAGFFRVVFRSSQAGQTVFSKQSVPGGDHPDGERGERFLQPAPSCHGATTQGIHQGGLNLLDGRENPASGFDPHLFQNPPCLVQHLFLNPRSGLFASGR
jgi:hypothetical protein